MTLYRDPYIRCDWRNCYFLSRDLHITAYEAADIRTALAAHGWSRLLGADYCDHHPLAEHAPTLTKERDRLWDGVRASCSCGWQQDGAALSRRVAVLKWQAHLPEEDDRCMHRIRAAQEDGAL